MPACPGGTGSGNARSLKEISPRAGFGNAAGERGRVDFRLRAEQFGEAGRRRTGGALQFAPEFGQRAARTCQHDSVEHEGCELTACHVAGDHVLSADPEAEGDGAEAEQDDDEYEPRARSHTAQGGAHGIFHAFGEAHAVQVFMCVGLHGGERGERVSSA